jgi:hypothetical protein
MGGAAFKKEILAVHKENFVERDLQCDSDWEEFRRAQIMMYLKTPPHLWPKTPLPHQYKTRGKEEEIDSSPNSRR